MILFILFSFNLLANTTFNEGLNGLLQIDSKSFHKEVEGHKKIVEEILEEKNKQCLGDTSQKELCLTELKGMKIKYIKTLYETRKIYLRHVHEQRISQLDNQMQTLIQELESTNTRKRRRKK